MNRALRIKHTLPTLLAACMVVAGNASAQQTIRLTFATGYPAAIPPVQEVLETFLPGVNQALQASGNRFKVEWTIAHSGTLAKVPAMLQATTDGLADVALLAPVFEPVKLPLDNVGFAAPFAAPNHRLAARVVNAMHRDLPAFKKTWEASRVVHLASISNESFAFQSKFPIQSLTDFKSRKVAGAGLNLPWIAASGAVAVQSNFATLYHDLQTGIAEGTIGFPSSFWGLKLNEIAAHLTLVELGAVSTFALGANKDNFDKLPAEVQAAIRTAAERAAQAFEVRINRLVDASLDNMTKSGVKIAALPREENLKWAKAMPPYGLNWIKDMEAKGLPGREVLAYYLQYMRTNGAAPLRNWDRE